MSLLTLVQEFCGARAIPVPSVVVASTDPQVLQIRRGIEDLGDDLAKRGPWQELVVEKTFTTIAAEDQGATTTVFGSDFSYILSYEIWDRTQRRVVAGPAEPNEWQYRKAVNLSGPIHVYRIRRGKFLVNPAPTAGHTWALEYVSKNWILAADGTTYKSRFTADTDTLVLPEDLFRMGLAWWWKKEKGLAYAQEFAVYEENIANHMTRAGGLRVLDMGAREEPMRPGIFIPEGSWPV